MPRQRLASIDIVRGAVLVLMAIDHVRVYSGVPAGGATAGFGAIMVREPAERRRLCLGIGLGATALFVVVGGLGVVMSPAPADAPPALFPFLNQRKYPAS